mmetsp:Transcript_29585/g.86169  ORF Transcript_29585/g.86169 Transcript_29585/m.86169 type:complete len:256 (+) Transcript_29585:1652-2419(+)
MDRPGHDAQVRPQVRFHCQSPRPPPLGVGLPIGQEPARCQQHGPRLRRRPVQARPSPPDGRHHRGRAGPGGQPRPHPGRRTVRPRARPALLHLRHRLDQGRAVQLPARSDHRRPGSRADQVEQDPEGRRRPRPGGRGGSDYCYCRRRRRGGQYECQAQGRRRGQPHRPRFRRGAGHHRQDGPGPEGPEPRLSVQDRPAVRRRGTYRLRARPRLPGRRRPRRAAQLQVRRHRRVGPEPERGGGAAHAVAVRVGRGG